MMDWDDFLQKMQTFPPQVHNLRLPCHLERVKKAELLLGQIPIELSQMLERFNGGKLFINGIAFVTIFGLSMPNDSPTFDWFIDRYTPAWRSKIGQPMDWVIGMTNYGGVQILERDSFISEWDSSQNKWMDGRYSLSEWLEKMLADGAACLDEA